MNLAEQMERLGREAREASHALAQLATAEKNAALLAMADALEAGIEPLQAANREDLKVGESLCLTKAMMDRLSLDPKRIRAMAQGLRDVAALPDPVGRILDDRTRPNGLRLQKITVPLGVIVIIYESRPNVTADAASLCLKSGNATILRGGKEALNSNQWIARTMVEAGRRTLGHRFPDAAIQVVPTSDRAAIPALLSLTQYVDLCMPRGGEGLIRAVTEASKVPVIKHFKGVCHIYVHAAADLVMALEILDNAKTQRPSTCNAAETVLVDREVADAFLPKMAARLASKNVELRADPASLALLSAPAVAYSAKLVSATDADYDNEYNDYILNVRVVEDLQHAIAHIRCHGSAHSDAIVTGDASVAHRFLAEVDSAAVYWNASTRFTDGGEFGMGAEIGISTDKLHARGPMGLEELCSYKWIGVGTGQVRA
jgi:glutamate-5-semialdehyde dehydrogenase